MGRSVEQRDECDELLLQHHVSLKLLLQDFQGLMRVAKLDEETNDEMVFVREKMEVLVEQFRVDYHDFRCGK